MIETSMQRSHELLRYLPHRRLSIDSQGITDAELGCALACLPTLQV